MNPQEYWASQPTDQPHNLNGFKGVFAISDHNLIPGPLQDYILECFPKAERLRKIALEDINRVLNEAWQGPGSMPMIIERTQALRAARRSRSEETIKLDEVKTIDDYSSDDFEVRITLDNDD